MYFGDQIDPMRAPKSDADWDSLFRKLLVPPTTTPTDAIVQSYKEATKEWGKVRSKSDLATANELVEFLRACVCSAYLSLVEPLADHDQANLIPELSSIIPQLQCMRVRETEEGKEYSILLQLRDIHGRSMAIFERGMSIPTDSPVMIEILSGSDLSKTRFIIRSSKEAFIEDVSHAQRMLSREGTESLTSGFRPVLFRTINKLLDKKFGEEASDPGFVKNIYLEKVETDPRIAIAHIETRQGCFRAEVTYSEATCSVTARLGVEHDGGWNSDHLGE